MRYLKCAPLRLAIAFALAATASPGFASVPLAGFTFGSPRDFHELDVRQDRNGVYYVDPIVYSSDHGSVRIERIEMDPDPFINYSIGVTTFALLGLGLAGLALGMLRRGAYWRVPVAVPVEVHGDRLPRS